MDPVQYRGVLLKQRLYKTCICYDQRAIFKISRYGVITSKVFQTDLSFLLFHLL
jgi:hypothetical protein